MAGVPYFSNLRAQNIASQKTHKKNTLRLSGTGCFSIGLPCFNFGPAPGSRKGPHHTQAAQNFTEKPQEGLLAEAATNRVIEKAFEEANKPKQIDFASNQAIQSFAKLAQTKGPVLNPFVSKSRPRKRKRDIFD